MLQLECGENGKLNVMRVVPFKAQNKKWNTMSVLAGEIKRLEPIWLFFPLDGERYTLEEMAEVAEMLGELNA